MKNLLNFTAWKEKVKNPEIVTAQITKKETPSTQQLITTDERKIPEKTKLINFFKDIVRTPEDTSTSVVKMAPSFHFEGRAKNIRDKVEEHNLIKEGDLTAFIEKLETNKEAITSLFQSFKPLENNEDARGIIIHCNSLTNPRTGNKFSLSIVLAKKFDKFSKGYNMVLLFKTIFKDLENAPFRSNNKLDKYISLT